MSPAIEVDMCPLFDTSDVPYCECIAGGGGCSPDNAEMYKMCPVYKKIIKALGLEQ